MDFTTTHDLLALLGPVLTPRQLAVVMARYTTGDATIREAAETLGSSTATVKRHEAAAMAAIRRQSLLWQDELRQVLVAALPQARTLGVRHGLSVMEEEWQGS